MAGEERLCQNDILVKGHELSDRLVTLHDEETTRIYQRGYLVEARDVRDQLFRRGIRNATFDGLCKAPQNGADLRTTTTALEEMAGGLHL